MKNIRYLILLGLAFVSAAMFQGCDDDEETSKLSGASFERTISSFSEGDGSGTVDIAIDDYSGSDEGIEFEYTGSAIEGVDYEVVGFSNGVLAINVLEDDSLELTETINVRIVNADGGVGRTRTHTLSIYSNCEDVKGLDGGPFAGAWAATEYYCGFGVTTGSCDFGPYAVTLTQSATNPNRLTISNFYGSNITAYVDFNTSAGTVYFPNQNSGGSPITASTGTYTVDLCEGSGTLTINLHFDGSDWIYYLVK